MKAEKEQTFSYIIIIAFGVVLMGGILYPTGIVKSGLGDLILLLLSGGFTLLAILKIGAGMTNLLIYGRMLLGI